MKKKTIARLDMYLQVRSVIQEFQTEWSTNEAYATAYDQFSAALEELAHLSEVQKNTTAGVRIAKDALMIKVIENALSLAAILNAYACEIEDDQLKFLTKIHKSDLSRGTKMEKMRLLSRILELAQIHFPLLASYGVTQDKIDLLTQGREELSLALLQPRKAIIDRKTVTLSINEVDNKLSAILKGRLDNLMISIKKEHPEFHSKYFAARLIIDRATHKAPTREIPDEPDDGSVFLI